MMKLKICFNNETHRISRIPETYEALLKTTSSIFLTTLPENWTLEYVDLDGDKITIRDEQDFKEFMNSEVKNKTASSAVKLMIVPLKPTERSQIISVPELSQSSLKKKQEEEDYQVIDSSSESSRQPLETSAVKLVLEKPVEEKAVQLPQEPAVEKENVPEETQAIPQESEKVESPKVEEPVAQPDLSAEQAVADLSQPLAPVEQKKAKNQPKKTPAQKKLQAPKVKKETVVKVNGQNLEELINKAVEKNLAKIASMTQAYLNKVQPEAKETSQVQPQSQPPAVHRGVRCDGCKVYPIVGIRYKCSVMPDFDFCELCEKTKEHKYAFIKIKFPGQAFSHAPRVPHPCPGKRIPLSFFTSMCPVIQANSVQPPAEQTTSVSQTKPVPEPVVVKKEVKEEVPVQTEEKIKVEEVEEAPVQTEEETKVEEVKEVQPEPEVRSSDVTIVDETDKVFKDGRRLSSKPAYSREIVTKAAKLKQRLPNASYESLLAFVNNAPADLSLAELAENYRF